MHARIPLSVMLSAPGRRHAIPHATLSLPKDSGFFAYLDSSDTRLPNHPYLNGRAVDPMEYDTYVGEDVWNDPANIVDSAEDDSDKGDAMEGDISGSGGADSHPRRVRHSKLVFDDVVEWLVEQLEEDWAKDGVVVCGRYVVADDASWAVPSRSPTVYTPREAFMVLRCSCKLLADIHTQRTGDAWAGGMAEITVAKAMAGSAAKELRMLVPYRLSLSDAANPTLSSALWLYAGVCQRHTDVCFPSLMAWTEKDHHDHFSGILERVRKCRLLERATELNPGLLSSVIRRWQKKRNIRSLGGKLVLLLAVDLLFESATLPIHLLSAKVRLFEAEERDPLAFEGLATAPYVVEPPQKDAKGEQADSTTAAPASGTDNTETAIRNDAIARNGEGNNDSEPEDEEEEDEEDHSAVNFFRLFRDELNWNRYLEEMESRWEEATRVMVGPASSPGGADGFPGTGSISIDVLSELRVKNYCAVASEASDLVTAEDTLTKRGLPLELLQPDLLKGDEQGMTFLRRLGETLTQEAKQK